jgi:hypothetical protein
MQGAQILSNDPYLSYSEAAKDAAQRSSWAFYKADFFPFGDIINGMCAVTVTHLHFFYFFYNHLKII